jgi:hypothetical protein
LETKRQQSIAWVSFQLATLRGRTNRQDEHAEHAERLAQQASLPRRSQRSQLATFTRADCCPEEPLQAADLIS